MNTICVYCGSSPGKSPEYFAAARELGQELVKRDLGLVYGGASVGVMGAVADAVLQAGGKARLTNTDWKLKRLWKKSRGSSRWLK